ncbi:MAG: RNA polymerase subunit sigma-70 [Clostridiales bacterium]|nr:RNA polymerase subunit sigma-70 [Clostridiales bacterium]
MTKEQQNQIHQLRSQGCGYKAIAKALSLPLSTVQSFCRRNNLTGSHFENPQSNISKENAPDKTAQPVGIYCKQCGNKLPDSEGHKTRIFCSDECRMKWWNSHQEQVARKAVYTFTCAHCGQKFTAYGNKNRKYCSHNCYIQDRFGVASNPAEGGMSA